ncbi:flavin reductase family protein [Candidatus Woesearchaeota archaeon]|nr:flavin reductase family protein [Candidatus Woesearchaeota archaeon]
MDLPWGDEKTVQFITNVGLITSNGVYGHNVMSAEWTHHVSYSPGLIAVCIGHDKATIANIRKSKEFGISIASTEQNVMASVAGGSSGKNIDKVAALKELGFKFYNAKKINALMIEGAVMNIECKLFKEIILGDHTMIVGEAIDASLNEGKEPLAYHKLKYWKIGENIPKPQAQELEKIREVVEKYRKS